MPAKRHLAPPSFLLVSLLGAQLLQTSAWIFSDPAVGGGGSNQQAVTQPVALPQEAHVNYVQGSYVPRGRDHIVRPPVIEEMFASGVADLYSACPRPGRPMVMGFAGPPVDHPDPAAYVCAFIRSWRMHAPQTRVVLFTDSITILNKFMRRKRRAPQVRILMVSGPPPLETDGWVVWRNWYYLRFTELCTRIGQLGPIMVGDVRDGIVLNNVWQHPAVLAAVASNSVIFSLEGNPEVGGKPQQIMLRDSIWNAMNSKACFQATLTPEVYSLMMSGPVSCAGYTVGAGDAMLKYFQNMIDVLQHNASVNCWWRSSQGGSTGDQSVHIFLNNVLAKLPGSSPYGTQLNFSIMALSNGVSPIYTAKYGMPVTLDILGGVTVKRGSWVYRPSVLHQYDRDLKLTEELQHMYSCLP